MFETIYLTSAEKEELLYELVYGIAEAIEAKKEAVKIAEKFEEPENDEEHEEMTEPLGIIVRKFHQGPIRKSFIEEQPAGTLMAIEPFATEEELFTYDKKIDHLINDPKVKMIESYDGIVRIKQNGAFIETGFTLSEQEVRSIIKKFSENTRIPISSGGIFKASWKNLTINAIISDRFSSRFLIIISKEYPEHR